MRCHLCCNRSGKGEARHVRRIAHILEVTQHWAVRDGYLRPPSCWILRPLRYRVHAALPGRLLSDSPGAALERGRNLMSTVVVCAGAGSEVTALFEESSRSVRSGHLVTPRYPDVY